MMFSTTLAVMAVSGMLSANLSVQPAWQTDYKAALTLSVKEQKPLAVFITKGSPKNLDLPEAAAKVLKANYIVVSINTEDALGKKQAEAFEMTEGVVISDKTGSKQALRIEGQTAPADLPQTLERLAAATQVVTTEVQGAPSVASTVVPSYYAPSTYCPSCQQGASRYRR